MKVYYIWDALCGWCYGFGAILTPFLANHPELEVEIISGGLFLNERSLPIAAYHHIPKANEQITHIYGVSFGENYNKLLQDGKIVLDSYHPAVGFSVLKNYLPNEKHILLAKDLQKAFYENGQSLSEISTYENLALKYQLNAQEICENIQKQWTEKANHSDFQKAKAFGVQSYPTLILEKEGKFYDLKGNTVSISDLEQNLEIIKNLDH